MSRMDGELFDKVEDQKEQLLKGHNVREGAQTLGACSEPLQCALERTFLVACAPSRHASTSSLACVQLQYADALPLQKIVT